MSKKRESIRITYYEGDPIRTEWDEFRGDKTALDAFKDLFAAHDTAPNTGEDLDKGESADIGELARVLVDDAREIGVPLATVIQSALQAYSETTNPEGQGTVKIAAAVREIMADNVKAADWFDREAITGAGVFTKTGSNQGTIRKWLQANKAMIDAHHAKMGIDPANHNRQASQHRRSN